MSNHTVTEKPSAVIMLANDFSNKPHYSFKYIFITNKLTQFKDLFYNCLQKRVSLEHYSVISLRYFYELLRNNSVNFY